MTIDFKKVARKILAFVVAILLYYIIHEGAHLVFALATGTFRRINFIFPGIQIQIDGSSLTNFQLGIFNLVGALATLLTAYILFFTRKKIVTIDSNIIRAIFYYFTILFLLNDPIYLSVLCDLFGGGDMNGIALLIPEVVARIIFGIVGLINLGLIIKFVFPEYRKGYNHFNEKEKTL